MLGQEILEQYAYEHKDTELCQTVQDCDDLGRTPESSECGGLRH